MVSEIYVNVAKMSFAEKMEQLEIFTTSELSFKVHDNNDYIIEYQGFYIYLHF